MDDEHHMTRDSAGTPDEPDDAAVSRQPNNILRPTRRKLLRAGLGLAAGAPLAGLLAACAASSQQAVQPTPTLSPTATVPPLATPDTRPITVVVTGDVMLGRSVNDMILATSDRFPFNYTADYLKSFDLTVGNLECVVSKLGVREPKEFTFPVNPAAFNRLVAAGFDVMSVANNHSGDMGKTAFMDMMTHLPRYNIQPVGGGRDIAAAHTPLIRTIRTTTVGFLTYCEIGPENFAATTTSPGHAWLAPDLLRADIQRVRRQVDYLIVFTHWGIEYQLDQTAHQVAMARLAIDAGADFVVGAHPHVREPSEIYKGKPIVYSLGNFVFDLMPGPEESQGNVLALTIQGSKLLHWKLRTARIVGSYGEPRWE